MGKAASFLCSQDMDQSVRFSVLGSLEGKRVEMFAEHSTSLGTQRDTPKPLKHLLLCHLKSKRVTFFVYEHILD